MVQTADQWAERARSLVDTDDADEIRLLEIALGCTQQAAVDHFIEDSCCSEDLPDFVGGRGTPLDRRYALRALWNGYDGEEPDA